MIDKVGVVALLLAVALSGCASEDAPPALTQADCEALGLTLKESESHAHGEEAEEHEAECVEPEPVGPRGIVTLATIPAEVSKFTTLTINWTLGTTNEDGKDHAMDTRIMMSSEPLTVMSSKPDDFGTQIAQFTHQNFDHGAVYTTDYSFAEEGTFYIYAFALIGGNNIWSTPSMLTVGPVSETGIVHDITVAGLGPQASIEKCSLTLQVGDKIQFTNDDLLSRTFEGTGFSETVDGQGGSSAELLFIEPGSVSYTSKTDLRPLGDLTCTLNVQG